MINEYYLLLFASVGVASFSQILLKKSAIKIYNTMWREYVNFYVITGYFLMIVSTILTILAYRGMNYKNGMIIDSVGFLLVMLWSRIFFNEKITKRKILGNCLILLGIFVFYS